MEGPFPEGSGLSDAGVVGAGSCVEDATYSPNDEAAAAVALHSFAKRCSIGLGQAGDAKSINSLAINAGLVQSDCRSIERRRIPCVESLKIVLGFLLRF